MKLKDYKKALVSLFKPTKIPDNPEILCPHCYYPLLDRDDFFDVDIVDETWHPEARSMCSNIDCAKQFRFSSGRSRRNK